MSATERPVAPFLTPILVHTSEEVWDHLNIPNKPESVHLAEMPTPGAVDNDLLDNGDRVPQPFRWKFAPQEDPHDL